MQGHDKDLTLQLRKEEQLLIVHCQHQPNKANQTNRMQGHGEDLSLQLREEEQLLIINRLHQVIRPFMLRRTKREVGGC